VNDDAVAPVIAVMLLLAIGVTFFAAWNAYYVPSMKAQSEITHIKDVESGFLRFSSNIETAASLKKNMRLSEPIPLGGGEFTFDPVKSGGTLRIQNETRGYMRMTISNGTTPDLTTNILYLSNFSYQPVNNFWQDQGYVWSYGNVNVTKGTLATPLQYTRMDEATYGVTGTVFDLDIDATCSRMNVYTVNITPVAGHTLASGNGNGMLMLNSLIVPGGNFPNATIMNISINRHMPEGFQRALLDSVNRRINELSCNNVRVTYHSDLTADVNPEVGLEFDPIPNMTLNRRITEISLGAY
jgi:hypothetical protein